MSHQDAPRAYVLNAKGAGVESPREVDGTRSKVVRRIPKPPPGPDRVPTARDLKAELAVPKPLRMTPSDQERLAELRKTFPRLHEAPAAEAAEDCGGHQAIGTVEPGFPLAPLDTVGTWVSMPIFEHGIDGFSGFLFTTFSNIAAQTLEVLGAYSTGNGAELSVFDWSCYDGKQGAPECDADNPWMYVKSQADIPSRYKFSYWDGCGWRRALALANMSRAVVLETQLRALFGLTTDLPLYLNQAKILDWQRLEWDTFYARVYVDRDPQPPRPWGPTAFIEFVSDAGCPVVPRLGFREIRFLHPNSDWELATPGSSTFRFDLPNTYHYGLLDPNHTWCIAKA
jgi:hypothetical protein